MSDQPAPDQAALFVVLSPEDDDDPAILDDMGAELDDTPADPDDGEPGPALEDGDTAALTAICRGGPYDARSITSRYPRGFLLADKASGRAYVYDFDGDAFICRDPNGAALDDAGRWRAAEEATYDVLAYDPEVAAT